MNTDKIYAESITSEYAPKQTSKVVAFKKLDRQTKLGANIFTYSFGIISALVLGLGICLSMNVIGGGTVMMVLGIVLGLIGIAGVSVNYTLYKRMLGKGKGKYGADILKYFNAAQRMDEALIELLNQKRLSLSS